MLLQTLGRKGYDFWRDLHPADCPISQLWRHTVCLRSGTVSQRLLCPRAAEFPAINPAYSGEHRRLEAFSRQRHVMWCCVPTLGACY